MSKEEKKVRKQLCKKDLEAKKEQCRKMGLAGLGRHLSEETKRKISMAKNGVKFTREHKRKISIALKGRVFSEEHKKNLSLNCWRGINGMKGKHHSKKTKKQMSISRKRYFKRMGLYGY